MYEMTLEGLLRVGNSWYGQNEAEYLIIYVQVGDNSAPEIIINPKENFKEKLKYYSTAYSEDLTLKNNTAIKIINYDYVEDLSEYFGQI